MKIRLALLERFLLIPAAVVVSPLLLIIGVALAVEWLCKKKRKAMGPSLRWRPWFAWYPVTIGAHVVWLQWVERRLFSEYCDFKDYRLSAARPLSASDGGKP